MALLESDERFAASMGIVRRPPPVRDGESRAIKFTVHDGFVLSTTVLSEETGKALAELVEVKAKGRYIGRELILKGENVYLPASNDELDISDHDVPGTLIGRISRINPLAQAYVRALVNAQGLPPAPQ